MNDTSDEAKSEAARDGELHGLLNIIEAGSAAFSLCEVGAGCHLVGAPFDGVGAYLVLAGTLHMRGSDAGIEVARTDTLMLLPAGHPPSMTTGPAAPTTRIDGARAIRRRNGIAVIDACNGRDSDLTVAAARIVGSGQQDLSAPIVIAMNGPIACQLLAMLRAEFARENASGALAASLMSACVALALRGVAESGSAARRSDHHVTSISRAIAAITTWPAAVHSIETLAEVAGMSRSTFLRQFASIMACSPMEFLLRTRLKEAAAMLRSSDLPVQKVAEATGFVSRSHFSRAFRNAFGIDPTAYRQEEPVETIA